VNYAYWSGNRFEEYLMVDIVPEYYPVLLRNLTATFQLSESSGLPSGMNEDILSRIGDWWKPEHMASLEMMAPRQHSKRRDRIIFDRKRTIIYFYTEKDSDYLTRPEQDS